MAEKSNTETVEALGGDPQTPLALRLINAFCVLMLVAIGVAIIFIPYTRSERVQGRVQAYPGSTKIHAQLNSIVTRQYVKEGDLVHVGQTLLSLSTERQLGSGKGAQVALAAQAALREQTLRQEIANIHSLYDSELSLLNTQIARKKSELAQANTSVET